MDKFVLAENPMRENDDQYIVHLLQPVAIFKVALTHEMPIGKISKNYSYQNPDGLIEEYNLSTHYLSANLEADPEEIVTKLLDKAWRWYRAYLSWEDKNIDIDNHATNN